MKTVGQLFRIKREEKNLSVEDVEKTTKIRKKFIESIEKGDYDKLPPSAFTRGFIKNYSEFLGLDNNEVLALYRREFDERKDKRLLPKSVSDDLDNGIFKINPKRISFFLIIASIVLIISYLVFQYLNLSGGPYLSVATPQDNSIVAKAELEVSGKVDPEAQLKINSQQVLAKDGEFKEFVLISEGLNTVTVEATSRNGKTSVVQRHVRLEIK